MLCCGPGFSTLPVPLCRRGEGRKALRCAGNAARPEPGTRKLPPSARYAPGIAVDQWQWVVRVAPLPRMVGRSARPRGAAGPASTQEGRDSLPAIPARTSAGSLAPSRSHWWHRCGVSACVSGLLFLLLAPPELLLGFALGHDLVDGRLAPDGLSLRQLARLGRRKRGSRGRPWRPRAEREGTERGGSLRQTSLRRLLR